MKGLCLLKRLSLEIKQKKKIKHQRSRVDDALVGCVEALVVVETQECQYMVGKLP